MSTRNGVPRGRRMRWRAGPRTAAARRALTAAGVAAGLWFWGDRLPRAVYPALCALGSLLLTVAVHFGGVDGPAFAFLYVWAVLHAFSFFFPGRSCSSASASSS